MMVSGEITYPTQDPDRAYDLLVDRAYREEVCRATGALTHDVSIETYDDGGASVTVSRVLPASASDAVKRLVGETVKVVQTEEWHAPGDSGTRTADLVIEIMGQPATMKGSIELRSSGTSVVQTITGDLKVSVPFFGKKIEPEIADAILAAIAVEQEVATYRLSR